MKAPSPPTGAEVRQRIDALGIRLCLLQAKSIERRVHEGAPLLPAWREALALTLVSPSADASAVLTELAERRPSDDGDRGPLRKTTHKLVLVWKDIAERGPTGNRLPSWYSGLMLMLHQAALVEPWSDEAAALFRELVELHGVVVQGVTEAPLTVDVLNGPGPWH